MLLRFYKRYYGGFSPVADERATRALAFYERYADMLDNPNYFDKLIDLEEQGFDMDMLRAYCKVGKSYSHLRFMSFIAKWFGTTVSEMKQQWRNI